MPLKNPIACRYLVSRLGGSPAVRTYCYFRRWDEELAAFIKGTVTFDWKAQSFDLAGKSQIKISLKTCDQAIARDRWAPVHAQVEMALASAQRAFSQGPQSKSAGDDTAIRISAQQIAAMVEQRRFDMVEEADRRWEGEAAPSPIKRILERASQAGEAKLAGRSPGELELQARMREYAIARSLHNSGAIEGFEFAMRETELDVPPPANYTSEDVGRILSAEELPGMVRDEKGDLKFDPATTIAQRLIHSPAHEALAANGFDLSDNIVNHRQLAFALLRGEVETHHDLVKRAKGSRIALASTRPQIVHEVTNFKGLKTLEDVIPDWIVGEQPSSSSIRDANLYVRRFTAVNGKLDVREINSEHIMAFRHVLLSFPRSLPTKLKTASIDAINAYGATLDESERLDRRTVNKGIGSISTLLKLARATVSGFGDRNVAAGCRLKITDKKKRQGLPFTIEEINRFVTSPICTDPTFRPLAGGGEAGFWLPLLAMFTGCRLEELGQLLISDVKMMDGIACLSITDIPDDDRKTTKIKANKNSSRAKTVKSEAARRIVAIHPILIALGFLSYFEKAKLKSKDRLFPDLRAYGEKVTKNFSRFINRYIDKHMTDNRRKNFHSFRHNFIDATRNEDFDPSRPSSANGVPGTLSAAVGHSDAATTALYGHGPSVQKLYREICKLEYKGLDLSKVKSAQ